MNNIKYFLPTYRQCWIMVFYIIVLGGMGIGFAMAVAGAAVGFNMLEMNPVVTYVAPMIPVLLYVLFKGNETAANNAIAAERGLHDKIVKGVPLNRAYKGGIHPILLVLLIIAATIAAMIAIEPVTMIFPMPESVKEIYLQMIENPFWTTISVAVAAPLIEEFLLRGVMLRGMLQHMTTWHAILWSAFFFALIHMNLSQAVGAIIMGIFMGWIYYKTGQLWLTILIHFINNGLSILFTLLFPQDIEMSLMDLLIQQYNPTLYMAIYIVSVVTLGAIICYLHKNLKNEQNAEIVSIQI